MPRKSGKSALISGLALWALYVGPDGGEVYSVAGDREQARITFGTGRRMVELDAELAGKSKLYRDAIEYPETGSVWRVVSSDAPLKEGLSPTFTVVDEVHVIPDELWNVFALAMGARHEPMLVGITTAGVMTDSTGGDSLCFRLYQHGVRVASAEVADPSFYFAWWGAPAGADHRDPAVWRAANPGYGDILAAEDLAAAVGSTPENEFRTKRLNQWVASAQAWLPYGAWDLCRADLQLDPALPLHVGIDASLRNDATAVVAAQRQGARIVVRPWIWENPGDDPEWKVPRGEVEARLRTLREEFPVTAAPDSGKRGPAFWYDPAFFSDTALRLEGDGLAMLDFPQSDARMVPACQGLYELVLGQVIAHDGDPALARHISNAAAKETGRGWRLTKGRGQRAKIDGAIALAIGTSALQEAPAPRSTPRFIPLVPAAEPTAERTVEEELAELARFFGDDDE